MVTCWPFNDSRIASVEDMSREDIILLTRMLDVRLRITDSEISSYYLKVFKEEPPNADDIYTAGPIHHVCPQIDDNGDHRGVFSSHAQVLYSIL